MPIKGDTSLSSFSGKELAESSAIHGDFNQASINYSGHQNLEVRGAESFGAELVGGPCEICGEDLFRDYDDSMGDVCLSCYYEERSKKDDEGSEYDGWLLNFAESFGADSQPIYERKYRQIVVDDNFKNKLKTLESLIKSLNEAIHKKGEGSFDVVETEALRRAVSEVYFARDILMGGYWESESFGAEGYGPYAGNYRAHVIEYLLGETSEDEIMEVFDISQEDLDTYWDAESFGAESYSESDLHDLIQSIWDGLGEAGRNEHYELFREYFGEGEEMAAEYGKRQRFGNRYVARDTKGKFISNVSVGRSLKADRRNKSKTPARSGFGHKGDARKGASGEFKLPTDAKSLVGIGAVLGGLWAYLESKA